MNVVHLYDGHEQVYNGKGSVPSVVWNMACHTAERGHDVTIIERQWDGLQKNAQHEGVSFRRLNLRTGATEPWERIPYGMVQSLSMMARLIGDRTNFALAAYRYLRKTNFDILHVHLPFAANVLLTLVPDWRDRTIYTAHLGDLRLNAIDDDVRDDLLSVTSVLSYVSPDVYLANRVSHTTVLNPNIADLFVQHGVNKENFTTLPNGVHFDRFANTDPELIQKAKSEFNITNEKVLLSVGTFMPRKGQHELIKAIDVLLDQIDGDIHLILCGETDVDETYTRHVKRLIDKAEIGNSVSIPGYVSSAILRGLYSLADVYVLPSIEEGFGMTVLEAMASGTPVVATRVGATEELIEHGEHGYLIEPNNKEELIDALGSILTESFAADRAIRQQAQRYSWKSITSQLIGLYEKDVLIDV